MARLALLGGTPVRKEPFASWPVFGDRERVALAEVLSGGVWGGYSPKVQEFETEFARFHGAQYAVSSSNGTVTLEAALTAVGVGPGDEVIVPPISFVATAAAVLRVGATPVFADIDPMTYNIDPARIREAIGEQTRAIIAVHFAGQPVDLDAIVDLAAKHGLALIEDSAHAHGASWHGRKVGTYGQFGSFSFQQSKNMTAGEGGILITNHPELAERARAYGNQGRRSGGAWYEHVSLGTNCRLTGWQAAVLLVQLSRLREQLECRTANAAYLTRCLRQEGIVEPPSVDERVTGHGYHLYVMRLKPDRFPGVTKANFVQALQAEGVPCHLGYPYPLYRNPVFESHPCRGSDCPHAERFCGDTFWVSHEILLARHADLDDFIAAIEKVARHAEELRAACFDAKA